MSANHQLVTFNISLEPAPVPTTGIGTFVLLVDNVTNLASGGGRYQIFTSYAQVVAAALAGAGSAAAVAAALVAFSSPRKPTLIMVNVDVVGLEDHDDAYLDFLDYGIKHFAVCMTSRIPAEQLEVAAVVNTLTGSAGLGVIGIFQTDEVATAAWPVALAAIEDTLNNMVIYAPDSQWQDVATVAARMTYNWDSVAPGFVGRLYGVTAPALTQSDLNAIKTNNINVVAPQGGVSTVLAPGVNAEGRPMDEVVSIYLFVDRLHTRLQRVKATYDERGQKIPISAAGQGILEAQIRATFQLLQAAGHFAEESEDPITGEVFQPIQIIFPTDLTDDIANKRLSATVNLQQLRGAQTFELDLNFTTSNLE